MQSVELFAGAGGLGIDVGRAGFKHAAVVEINRHCCETLNENRAGGHDDVLFWPETFSDDVRKFDYGKLEGRVSLVSGGPPCQPFSLGGQHRSEADTRDMFPEAVRALRELMPQAFIFENVKGLTRARFRNYREYITLQMRHPEVAACKGENWTDHLRRLEQHHTAAKRDSGLEYRVVQKVLDAADYGVPQRRERIFFVGFRLGLGIEWAFPDSTHSHGALLWEQRASGEYWERHKLANGQRYLSKRGRTRQKAVTEKPSLRPWLTVRDALSDLPDPRTACRKASEFHNHVFQPGARSYPGHTGSHKDEPAKTLKAGVHGVPGGENMVYVPSTGKVRYFSVRESARLQTFPDDFVFHGCWSEAMRQIGNAVPVKLAEVVARHVANALTSNQASTHYGGR